MRTICNTYFCLNDKEKVKYTSVNKFWAQQTWKLRLRVGFRVLTLSPCVWGSQIKRPRLVFFQNFYNLCLIIASFFPGLLQQKDIWRCPGKEGVNYKKIFKRCPRFVCIYLPLALVNLLPINYIALYLINLITDKVF